MTEDETAFLESMFAAIDDHGHMISDWERNFMKDQKSRYEKYGDDTRMSPKQWTVIAKIADKLGVEK